MNPTVDGRISWERNSSCTLDLEEEVEHWQNWLHEVTTLNCNMMIRSLRYVTTKARELPTYDGVTAVDEFLLKAQYWNNNSMVRWNGRCTQHPRNGRLHIRRPLEIGVNVEEGCTYGLEVPSVKQYPGS